MNIRMMAVAAFAASCAFGGARIETPLGGDGWKLWLDKKAEYKSDTLHLNPADAAKIRANAGDWLTPVDVRALSVAGPGCGWDRLFAKSVPWTEAEAAWKDSGLSLEVSVPGTVEGYFFDAISGNRQGARETGDYKGVSWWGRTFDVPAAAKGRRVVLAFREGIRHRAEVFVNRKLVGYELVLQSPFEVDVSDVVNYGGANELAVRITDANGNFSWGDYSFTKWGKYMFPLSHGFGGIPGGIDLVVTDPVRIEDVFVRNKPALRDIDTSVYLVNGSPRAARLTVEAAIVENWSGSAPVKNPKTVFAKKVGTVDVPAGAARTFDFNAVVKEAKLWEIHDSHLYDMQVALKDEKGALVDRHVVRFGFRFLEAKGVGTDAQLWLNGRRIFILSGISWGFWPSNGMFPTPELARRHVASAVKLGMNMLNCHRCRGNEAILNAADEMGVMYYEEPGGFSSYRYKNEDMSDVDQSVAHEICRQKLLRMVKNHRNHASLMIYNMVNEPGWEPDDRAKEDMALAHDLDPTRLIVYGSGFMGVGKPEPRKLNMLPYSREQNITGFTDIHNASASPGVYVDSNYPSPTGFARKERAATELFIWGEEGALAAPPQLELIQKQKKGTPPGWDGQQYDLWYQGYKSYLEKKGLTKNFPSITDLITSMGDIQYYEHGRLLENTRIADGAEAYIFNGYESMKDDNISGCVDCYRNHKGRPELVSQYMKPLVMSVKAREKLGATGDTNLFDLWVLNNYAIPAGTYRVRAGVKTPTGKVRLLHAGEVKVSGGAKFSDLAAQGIAVKFDDGPGLYSIRAQIIDAQGRALAKGHDEMFAVAPVPGRINAKVAIVGGGPEYVKYAESIGARVQPYDPQMGRLDGILLAPTDLGQQFKPIPSFNFRAKDGVTPGLNLDHFLGKKFETPVGQRVSTAAIDFDLKAKLIPGYDIIGLSNFSVRWEGYVVCDYTGEIEFEYTCDDGARVWFDGALVVDKWTNGPKQTRTFKKNLVAGKKYALKIEAYQDGGDWLASFKWKLPLPDVKCDLPDILRRVREDGTKLVLVEDAETWLKKLRDAKVFPEYKVFHPHKTWVGHNLFVKEHPFFTGLPVNCAMNWEYQKLVVYDGPKHFGLEMDGEEALVGIVGVPLRGIATSVGIVPYGKGRIVFSSLDIAPYLASDDKSAVTPKRIFANILNWTQQGK